MSSLFNRFYNYKFTDVYGDVNTFLTDYTENGLPQMITPANARTLYYLLYARYGNSTLSNADTNQFKYKLFSIIWQYGGAWQKKLEIQAKLRDLSLDEGSEIYRGAKAIYNSAVNPSTAPNTSTLEELDYINAQNTTAYKKSTLEGLNYLTSLLEDDVSNAFLNKFEKLFIQIIAGDTLYYVTEEEDGSND